MVSFQNLQALGYSVDIAFLGKIIGDKWQPVIHDFEGDQTYSEKLGHNFSLNANFEDVTMENYDSLVIPGGHAPEYLELNEKVLSIFKQFEEKKKLIASICHGQ